jgi:hypothetical protein
MRILCDADVKFEFDAIAIPLRGGLGLQWIVDEKGVAASIQNRSACKMSDLRISCLGLDPVGQTKATHEYHFPFFVRLGALFRRPHDIGTGLAALRHQSLFSKTRTVNSNNEDVNRSNTEGGLQCEKVREADNY